MAVLALSNVSRECGRIKSQGLENLIVRHRASQVWLWKKRVGCTANIICVHFNPGAQVSKVVVISCVQAFLE